MKKITEIKDDYAVEQGYGDWNELFIDDMFEGNVKNANKHIDTVIQLIQDELKKKIAEFGINTENIK